MFFKKNNNYKLPDKIVLSTQAYLSMVSEVAAFPNIETGGIFLGTIEDNNWYIIESIDPGYENITREQTYFVYDVDYVNHLANIRCRLYDRELILLGLWHRHPGSMDDFSACDKETNKKFVDNCAVGSISALINIDPLFRITMYYVSPNLQYTKLNNIVHGNNHIPNRLLDLKDSDVLLSKINTRKKKNNDIPSKLQEKLLEVLEYEYTSYLSQQKFYECEIRMDDKKIELNMKRIDTELSIPATVFVEIYTSDRNKIHICFNKKDIFEYKKDIICSYITDRTPISYNGAIEQKDYNDISKIR